MTFDVDADGILQVSAQDKLTGRSQKITITNDAGRLSMDEISRMLKNAERFEKDDVAYREALEAKNSLEEYVLQMHSSIEEEGFSKHLKPVDKKTIEDGTFSHTMIVNFRVLMLYSFTQD